jgi:hypothetical protein
VTDDMPFIVDSVTAFLARDGVEVYRLLHPVVDGQSFVHVEIPRESDAAILERLAAATASVLQDVRAAVSDWNAMRERVRSCADALQSVPASVSATDDVTEVVAFLDWLLDDHFTFVGAGAALHALNGRGEAIDDTFIEDLLDSATAGGAVMAGAVVQPLSRLRFYGEVRYSLTSDVRYPGIRLGAALMLPPRGQAAEPPQGGQ